MEKRMFQGSSQVQGLLHLWEFCDCVTILWGVCSCMGLVTPLVNPVAKSHLLFHEHFRAALHW